MQPDRERQNQVIDEKCFTLYHGSKSGITGSIAPISRSRCDFGRGFYMGTDRQQALTLICNYPHAVIYTVQFDLFGLSVLNLEANLDWAMVIALCRGKLEPVKDTALYKRVSHLIDGMDAIVGAIANDRMFVVLDRFFNGDITDAALLHCLSALQLGRQYAAVSPKACRQIEITESHALSENEREQLKRAGEENRRKGISAADRICRDYRREGKYFDEILREAQNR